MVAAQMRIALANFLKKATKKEPRKITPLVVIGAQTHVHNGGFPYDKDDPSTKRRGFKLVRVPIKYQPHVHKPGQGYAERLAIKRKLASLTHQA